jgi:hypothetical protein
MYQGSQRIWSLKKSVPQPISCWMGSSWPLTVINLTLTRYWGISFGFYLLAGKVLFNSGDVSAAWQIFTTKFAGRGS